MVNKNMGLFTSLGSIKQQKLREGMTSLLSVFPLAARLHQGFKSTVERTGGEVGEAVLGEICVIWELDTVG